jgi:hypothetical protein
MIYVSPRIGADPPLIKPRQDLAHDLAKPEERADHRYVWLADAQFDKIASKVQHARRVDNSGKPTIESEPHGAPEALLVAIEQRRRVGPLAAGVGHGGTRDRNSGTSI